MSSPLSRRSVIAGLAAAVTAIPAVGLSVARTPPAERVKLEKAMQECHPGSKIVTFSQHESNGFNPAVMVIAKLA